jgi:RNA polymerase sigma-70 factor (ECF subfamily)
MDAGHRAVFILFELEGESCESIAAGLEVPIGTVYSRLHAARRAFREHAARRARGAGRDDPEDRPMLQALRQPGLRPKESA